MAASQPRRGASVDQAQRLYTIRPLEWHREFTSGLTVAISAFGKYIVTQGACILEDDRGERSIVGRCTAKSQAKEIARNDLWRRLVQHLSIAGKAVRRG